MAFRSNEEWLDALSGQPAEAQAEALQDLRDYLLRAALIYLARRRSEVSDWTPQAIRQLAEDLAQETLIQINKNLNSFRGESQFTTWTFRFVINRAASELRRRRYRDLSLDDLREDELSAFQTPVQDTGPRGDPARLAERRYYLNLLRQLVDTELNERQRAAVVWVHLQGRSMDEVAAALGLNRNALYKLLYDARRRLKTQLLARHLSQGDILAAFED
jgi:RNA polymerase sigma-70 factor, ECF subfamily